MPDKNKYNSTRLKAIQNYRKNTVSVVTVTMPKEKKAEYQEAASEEGKSLNRFILDAVDEHLENRNDPEGSGR